MKLNKLLIATGVTGLLFTSCVSEFKNDVDLGVNVATEEGVSFDGQTITVKAGTPVNFKLSGEADFLTFFSGEAGHEYRYRDRITVAAEDVESSVLKFSITPQYGKGSVQLMVAGEDSFTGLLGAGTTSRDLYMQDSLLVTETAQWQPLSPKYVFGVDAGADEVKVSGGANPFEIDMRNYLGQRIAIGIRYQGVETTSTQTKFTFNNMQIENQIAGVTEPAIFAASSYGFTALNLLYCNPEFLDANGNSAVSGRRRTAVANKPYGTATNNTEGVWNVVSWEGFFIHSSGANTGPVITSWLISNLMVVNACTPDSGEAVKNITEGMSDYTYTYTEPGTYTATFYAANSNNVTESNKTYEYTVVVTE